MKVSYQLAVLPFLPRESSRVTRACGVSAVDSLLGQVSVPFDLVKKHPKGQQTFALQTKDGAVGSLTTEVRTATLSHTKSDVNLRCVSMTLGVALNLNLVFQTYQS